MKHLMRHLPIIITCAMGLMLMILFTACAGVAQTGPNGTTSVTITGTIQSVNTSTGSVTLTVNGQTVTVNGLTSSQISALQGQVGKTYSITATQNSDGTYTISTGTNPIVASSGTPEGVQETPGSQETAGTPEPGSISFIGKVQSISSSSAVVSLPDGSTLSIAINAQTDQSDFNGTLPAPGTYIKVEANANPDGSFTATKLKTTDSSDTSDPTKLNTVEYQGVTSSAVGADKVIHFTVGNKSFSFTIGSTADLGDFSNNAQSIQANQQVKVDVLFNGATGTVTKISNANS